MFQASFKKMERLLMLIQRIGSLASSKLLWRRLGNSRKNWDAKRKTLKEKMEKTAMDMEKVRVKTRKKNNLAHKTF